MEEETRGFRSVYEVTGGKFTLTRFQPGVVGRKLVRETFKTGDQFTAYNYEIPSGFMDLLKVVGPAPPEDPVPEPVGEVLTEDRTGRTGKESRKQPVEEKKPPRPVRRKAPVKK